MFEPSSKKAMLSVLVVCFAIQTGLVYSDDVDIELSADAVEGRELFHDGSCQVCHQLWGQGGFLGPDLTNASSRIDETRLTSLLTVGSGQMPAYQYDAEQIRSMRSFLEEIDRPDVGRGQLRLGDPATSVTPQGAFDAVVREEVSPVALAGFEAFASGVCSACHFPFQTSVVGAPDLSMVSQRLDDAELHEVLTNGRPELGMPPPSPALSATQRDQLIEYFGWLNDHRADLMSDWELRQRERQVDWSRLDWWEFR
ncbi:MAG: cytochrome c [Longimicrobiales bacterium]|jgi:nitric oxide reductase subunit C|nr:cytochrome c [Longimicrobiales bacterium]